CNGDAVSAINFSTSTTGGAVTYNWLSTMDIGFNPTSGTGSIPAFTATNTSNAAVTATISVSATINGCTGPLMKFNIKVNPSPKVTCPADFTAPACTYAAQADADAAFATWLGTASAPVGTLSNNNTGAPSHCGGTTTVTFTSTSVDGCGTATCSATFTITAA